MGGGVKENDSLSRENWSYEGFNLPRVGGLITTIFVDQGFQDSSGHMPEDRNFGGTG